MPAKLRLLPRDLSHNGDELHDTEPTVVQVEKMLRDQFAELVTFACTNDGLFLTFEKELWTRLLSLGRLLVVLFLTARQQRLAARLPGYLVLSGQRYQRNAAEARNLNTMFGAVRYFRTYMRAKGGRGHYPLDAELGLTQDRMSFGLLSLGARLATMMSFAKVHTLMGWFLAQPPSTEVLENTVLGLGRRTAAWFREAPLAQGDGDVLIIQGDSKGAPTATEQELKRRRGPRKKQSQAPSARHRGRVEREQRDKKPRRAKGDKAKNARLATAVVMYTLRTEFHDGKRVLCGPLNRWTYASFAPKRHAFEMARREADRRGFTRGSGKVIQVLTDGDEDLATYTREYFPEAIHTVDVIHVVEYLYKAAECLHREGSPERAQWIQDNKTRLYGSQEALIVAELQERLRAIPRTGPGNKGRRARLAQALGYLQKRLPQMNYQSLREQDLEIGTGVIEGTVKNLIGARFDFGGSRWIRERAEALLQLRCIERNGHWEQFIHWAHDQDVALRRKGDVIRIQQRDPAPLPAVEKAA